MPYNTRRKSLSLSELGITVPKRNRAVSHPSPPSTIVEGEEPPVKKSKRSHGFVSPPVGSMSPPRTTTVRIKEEKARPVTTLSPPPSPGREGTGRIHTEGINDDIVVGAIQQLEKTGNRPHLVKELAYVLATNIHAVEKSANPSALISSRLTAYLNRTWPAISPCPLAKDLSPVHPRRLYFYLTTQPHQPIPAVAEPIPNPKRIISPSLSSASAADEDERYNRDRTALSPSPEVDLSSPEFEQEDQQQPQSPGAPFSGRNSVSRDHPPTAANLSHNRRAVSPQLETEEHDFKETANALHEQAQQRRNSQTTDVAMGNTEPVDNIKEEIAEAAISIEVDEEVAAKRNSEDAAALFGATDHLKLPSQHLEFSSPVIQPQHPVEVEPSPTKTHTIDEAVGQMTLDVPAQANHKAVDAGRKGAGRAEQEDEDPLSWDNLQSPENVELDELENMFDAY